MFSNHSLLNKIPGNLTNPSNERYVDDLKKYTIAQLHEIRQREEKLLFNKKRLEKLPDKGKRIQDFYKKIRQEIENRNEIENAAELFSKLNIAAQGIETIKTMEWNGKYNSNQPITVLDSDDDDDDRNPIKILAQSHNNTKLIKVIESEKKLITTNDLKEINSYLGAASITVATGENAAQENVNIDSIELEPHAVHICEKEFQGDNKEKFLPFKTTKSDVHAINKEKLRKIGGKHWEITAATPPAIRNSEVKILSLQESIDVQAKQMKELKIIEKKHAEERLALRKELVSKVTSITATQIFGKNVGAFVRTYRDLFDASTSDDENYNSESGITDSDNEVYDDEPHDGGISIVIND